MSHFYPRPCGGLFLTWLPAPKNRREFWLKLPLCFTRESVYHLERLETTVGWHWSYLLVTLDAPVRNCRGWRLQWQRKAVPLTWTEQYR